MQPVIAANGLVEQVIPGSFASWRSEGPQVSTPPTGDRVLCILGEAAGGAPGEAYFFTQSSQDITSVLQSGPLLQATRFALGSGVAGVLATNVAPGTPATLEMQGQGGGVFGTLTTEFYRDPANQTRYVLVEGQDGYTLEISNALTGTSISNNRLGMGLYLQYSGAGIATAAIVDGPSGRTLSIEVEGAEGEDVELPLAGLSVADLIRQVQASGPYNALYARDERLAATGLDLAAARPINTFARKAVLTAAAESGATSLTVAALAAPLAKGDTLRARVGNSWVPVRLDENAAAGAVSLTVMPLSAALPAGNLFANRAQSPVGFTAVKADFELFFSVRTAGVLRFEPGSAAKPASQTGYFAGGTTLQTSPEDWEVGLSSALKTAAFGQAVALQSDRSVAYGLRAALQARRHPAHSSPVQFFDALPEYMLPDDNTPSALAAYFTEASSEIASINDRDSVMAVQTVVGALTPTGLQGREPMYMAALRAATTRAVYGPGASMTNKEVGGTDPYPDLGDLKDRFARAGALVLESPRRGQPARVTLGRTTYVGQDDLAYESEKTVCIMNAITRGVAALGRQTVPGEGLPSVLADYDRDLGEFFEDKVGRGWITAGYDREGNAVAAYQYTLRRTTFQGRLIGTSISCNPTPEFLMTDNDIVARLVDIEVN